MRISLLKVQCGLLAIAGLLIVSCDDDGPTTPVEPQESDYLVYYHYDADSTTYYMPRYSSRTLAPVDTIQLGSIPTATVFSDLEFTSDGKYAVYATGYPQPIIWVQDYATGDTIALTTQRRNRELVISFDNRYLISFIRGLGPVTVYSLPDLALVWSDSVNVRDVDFLAEPGKLVYSLRNLGTFYVVDFINAPDSVVKHQTLPDVLLGGGYFPLRSAVDNVRNLVYSVGPTNNLWPTGFVVNHLEIYDADDFTLYDFLPIPDNYIWLDPVVSPSGDHVYLRASLSSTTTDEPPGILRYNVQTQSLERYISGADVLWPPFKPQDMEITPDGKIMCLILSPGSGNKGDLAFIDIGSRQILNIQYHTFGRGEFVRVFPVAR